jgi:hypothetical protein
MRQIATERVQPGGVGGVDIAALYSQHQGDGYELYARHSNNQLVRMMSAFAAAKGSISMTATVRCILTC